MRIFLVFIILFIVAVFPRSSTFAQEPQTVASYPDEAGYQRRVAPLMQAIAAQSFGEKSKASSVCPDTGLPVLSWALEGETIISPYTGKTYLQGETGYFGPKARGDNGQITRFGGDPLKHDLPPATARLLLHPDDKITMAYLSIPGNLNQQYHFAAKNWARFYPMLGGEMGGEWQAAFRKAVANYGEKHRPSDGYRQYAPLSVVHNLVGESGELLGGNQKDGGTENHKTMWRTSGLLYAQLFPADSQISGYPAEETKEKISFFLKDYLRKMLTTSNGEYDSQIYYPHSIEAFLNLYDFSPDPETRALAKLVLDYYLATYALKVYDGALAGAQKRGSSAINYPGEMNQMLHNWFGTSYQAEDGKLHASLHQITSSYRPNRLIYNILHKTFETPFEAKIARPLYHMDVPNAFQEYFYGSKNFGLGSVYLTRVDNPNQQVSWSLVVKGDFGPMTFGGLQPYHRSPGGYSPYTQTLQYRNTILVASAPTTMSDGEITAEQASRQKSLARQPLHTLVKPTSDALGTFFQKAQYQAATWLFVPRQVKQIVERNNKIFIDAGTAYLVVSPSSPDYYWLEGEKDEIDSATLLDKRAATLHHHCVLVVPGAFSAYALEVSESAAFNSLDDYINATLENKGLQVDSKAQKLQYQSVSGDLLDLHYQPEGLRSKGNINGKALNFENWADGGAYQSPYVQIGNGKMTLTDGKESYTVDYSNLVPVYQKK